MLVVVAACCPVDPPVNCLAMALKSDMMDERCETICNIQPSLVNRTQGSPPHAGITVIATERHAFDLCSIAPLFQWGPAIAIPAMQGAADF